MYRGTTPTLQLKLKTVIDFGNIDQLYVTFSNTYTKLTLPIGRCTMDNENKTIEVTLTQEETLQFGASIVEVQVRIKLNDGKAYASSIANIEMNKILKDGVI